MFALSTLCACGGVNSSALQSADGIRAAVLENGAHNTVSLMNEGDRAAWQNFYRQVAAGEEKWLQLVPLVLGGSEHTGAIAVALAEALPKNPEGVLGLESWMVSMKYVCAMPFIEPDDSFIDSYYKRAMSALDGVRDEYFRDDKKICRQRLQEAMKNIRQQRSGVYNFK